MKARAVRRFAVVPLILLAVQAFAPSAGANHSWGGYHWARKANPFTLKLGDNVSSVWDSYLNTTSADWSASSVLDTTVVPGLGGSARRCSPVAGRVEICNTTYGSNGWLGVASVWASGSHITQGTVKMNDTYFNTAKYNTPAWRNLVMCQEVGHTLGLDHQDENFTNANLGSCMDYTNLPSSNQHPNAHDYAMLESIYGHLDSTTTVGAAASSSPARGAAAADANRHDEWGRAIRYSAAGRPILFVLDLPTGEKEFTWVVWAE